MADGELCTRPLVFPARPDNRPALPRIGYRIGSYSDFREHLMRRLDATPALAHWTHREPDDPGIALLECAAVLGDILTFYQELYANEVYLRTAAWRSSVAELVRLVGYRLAPGPRRKRHLRGGGPARRPGHRPGRLRAEGGARGRRRAGDLRDAGRARCAFGAEPLQPAPAPHRASGDGGRDRAVDPG